MPIHALRGSHRRPKALARRLVSPRDSTPLGLPWDSPGPTLALPWHYPGITLVLPWHCPGTPLVPSEYYAGVPEPSTTPGYYSRVLQPSTTAKYCSQVLRHCTCLAPPYGHLCTAQPLAQRCPSTPYLGLDSFCRNLEGTRGGSGLLGERRLRVAKPAGLPRRQVFETSLRWGESR